jgi:hypothetical protein
VTKEKHDEFVCRVQQLLEAFPHDIVITFDETHWKVVATGFWTWADPRSEAVSCVIDENKKEGITVLAGIDAAGAKFAFTVVRKGKR